MCVYGSTINCAETYRRCLFGLDRAEKRMPVGLGSGRVRHGRGRGTGAVRVERAHAERPSHSDHVLHTGREGDQFVPEVAERTGNNNGPFRFRLVGGVGERRRLVVTNR